MQHFGFDKNRELFRSFVMLDTIEQSLAKTKSAKKLKSNHARTQSFKSPNSNKFRGLVGIDQFLGIKKHSLKKSLRREMDESRSKQSTVKTKSKLRQVGDIADITSRIVKLSGFESDTSKFEDEVLHLFYNFSTNNINIAKAEMITILKYIFGYFNKATPKRKNMGTQTDPLELEIYKTVAKRLIVNSEQKPPEDPFENNLVLLFQKEILLDEILTILNEEDIDLNNLLSITLERIEANFYEPPADLSLNDGVSLNLEDKMKMPTPKAKWADPTVMNKLMIDLSKVDVQDSESEGKKSKPVKPTDHKIDLHNMKFGKAKEAKTIALPILQPSESPKPQDDSSFLSSAMGVEQQSYKPEAKQPDKNKPARNHKLDGIFGKPPDNDKWSA
jgi:hypothetical protein